MLFADRLCLLRGGGDLATGVAWRLAAAGFPVAVLELPAPLTVRRSVALSTAVSEGEVMVEGLVGRRIDHAAELAPLAATGVVPVLVAPALPGSDVPRSVVVDARLAKRNIDTSRDDAKFVVALGPGFVAGIDCHAVIETMRGHHLGRVLWSGAAAADTGEPGEVGGRGSDRVLRAATSGTVHWQVSIGDVVAEGQTIGAVGQDAVVAPFTGVVRGRIASGTSVSAGLKIGDLDPRLDTRCDEISDKALAIGGGVVEAVLRWCNA
jgi:xanthine dehydrogenase accessory factor